MRTNFLLLTSCCAFVFAACGPAGPAPEAADPALTPPETTTEVMSTTTQTPTPAPVADDLNGDGRPDYLEVITTNEDADGLGLKRQLIVYSGDDEDRTVWYTADNAILPTEAGGMMGNPLESARVRNGTIVVRHFGGSSEKWHYVHRYRWQNDDFELIGATIEYGRPCGEMQSLDYNLSTGGADHKRTRTDCETNVLTILAEESFTARRDLPSLKDFTPGETEIAIGKTGQTMYY